MGSKLILVVHKPRINEYTIFHAFVLIHILCSAVSLELQLNWLVQRKVFFV